MLFNSYIFILVFLPVSVLVYRSLRHLGMDRASIAVLSLLSLAFYAWWNPVYLFLLVPIMLANFAVALRIAPRDGAQPPGARKLLALAIAGNLGVLGYFKYANFFVNNLSSLIGIDLFLAQVVLPLGISFFTFQKVAFLVDVYRGRVDRLNLLDFTLFVSFFPQLIAGPIVHPREVLPQFARTGSVPALYTSMGLTIFVIGLAKKVLLADTAALYVTPGFDAAARGEALGPLSAWSSALAYTAQLYFDFSGYCDMAVGAALLFGIRLPINFNSPYKAASIIDFWHRWHITLSRFLRDYLYIPLGGNRHGRSRRHANLLLTMLLGGLWHGAAWTFVLWGGLHGAYLIVNHAWRNLRGRVEGSPGAVERVAGYALTFLAVVVGWVFFRAADTAAAVSMLEAMAGMSSASAPAGDAATGLLVAGLLLLIAWFTPNTQQVTGYAGPHEELQWTPALAWRPSRRWAVACGGVLGVCLLSLSRVSEFLYFQF